MSDERTEPRPVEVGGTGVPVRVARLLEHAAPRVRVVDEHMVVLPSRADVPPTCRVQVFTAPGTRPVIVATQTVDEGQSLTNAVERYAAAMWQRYLPDEVEPPIWIERQLGLITEQFVAVSFSRRHGRYGLGGPNWCRLTDQEVAELVGGPVDPGRGDGYVPRPVEEEVFEYAALPTARLPRPQPFREPDCMPAGISWWRRRYRQLVPRRRGGRDCCWYHGGDWNAATATAIRLALAAQRDGTAFDDIAGRVLDQARAEANTGWMLSAIATLVSPSVSIQISEDGSTYVNGQHRAQAMLDAGRWWCGGRRPPAHHPAYRRSRARTRPVGVAVASPGQRPGLLALAAGGRWGPPVGPEHAGAGLGGPSPGIHQAMPSRRLRGASGGEVVAVFGAFGFSGCLLSGAIIRQPDKSFGHSRPPRCRPARCLAATLAPLVDLAGSASPPVSPRRAARRRGRAPRRAGPLPRARHAPGRRAGR
jgi:hypothetical protein